MRRSLIVAVLFWLGSCANEQIISSDGTMQTMGLPQTDYDQLYHKEYDGFEVWLDCAHHGVVLARYELDYDHGSAPRSGSFKSDGSVPDNCQPSSGDSYITDAVDPATGTWDRGHMVPANHMDHRENAVRETFFLTNILPQQTTFNRLGGAWRHTEDISECYRDLEPLTIWAGVIWGDDEENDFFVETHSVTTPDYWWKVIRRHQTGDYIAWIFPNDKAATVEQIDRFLVSLNEVMATVDVLPPDFEGLEGTPEARLKTAPWPLRYKNLHTLICGGIEVPLS